MPDLQDFRILNRAGVTVNVPRFTIEAKIVDSQTGAVLADFTGLNAVEFPVVLTLLTPTQRRDLIEQLAQQILYMRAGL